MAWLVWLVKDFDLLSVLLRAVTFSFEALTLGGLTFLFLVLSPLQPGAADSCRRRVSWAALGLMVAQALATAVSAAALIAGSGFALSEVASIAFVRAGEIVTVSAAILFVLLRLRGRITLWACFPPAVLVLASAVAMSHAASRMGDRALLMGLTTLHHLGSAGWLGAMAFLWLQLRDADTEPLQLQIGKRYSALALGSVLMLVSAGVGMSWFYVGSWAGAYGTTYGLLVGVKVVLTLAMLLLGAGNYLLLRKPFVAAGLLKQLGRVTEAEIGLGFTVLLAAASLTTQSPAADVPRQDRASAHALVERLRWVAPSLSSPPAAALTPTKTTMGEAVRANLYRDSTSDANDRAWSEYNHHWAGLIVLVAGALALVGRAGVRPLARAWPLLFLALAVFIVLRADPEAWPLGPRGFWESFAEPDALEHRMEAALLCLFATFEYGVRSGRLHQKWAAYIFPLVCAVGGAILLTHAHAMGDPKQELLATLSHAVVAVLGIGAGWSRWLEVRAGAASRLTTLAAWTWPICLCLVGAVLLNYRES